METNRVAAPSSVGLLVAAFYLNVKAVSASSVAVVYTGLRITLIGGSIETTTVTNDAVTRIIAV